MDEIQFYDSQVEYQKRAGDIEKQRLQLERQMFSLMKSDKKLHNLKTAKLRSYWQQVCERERRARERNEELIRDFEKMEIELNALQSRTNRLRDMRRKYDGKVKQLYPKWRKEVELSRAKKQLEERGVNILPAKERNPESSSVINYPTYTRSGEQTTPEKQSYSGHRKSPVHGKPTKVRQSSSDHQISPRRSKNMAKSVKSAEDIFVDVDSNKRDQQKISFLPSPLTGKKIVSPRDDGDTKKEFNQTSSHPPPDSFADDSKVVKAVYVNMTAPSKIPSYTNRPVVHTIPTASPNDFSDFSDPSVQLESRQHDHEDSELESISVDESPSKQKISSSVSKYVPTAKTDALTAVSASRDSISITSPKSSQNERSKSRNSEIQSTSSPGKISPSKSSLHNSSLSSFSSPGRHGQMKNTPDLRTGLDAGNIGKREKFDLGSSFESTEGLSDREHAPLTANAAYQAMLKQHSGIKIVSPTFHESGDGSDEDDVDDILSPHATLKNDSEDSTDNKSEKEDSFNNNEFPNKSPVYIPTALSSTGSSLQPKDQLREVKSKPPKAPWDSDSEDDDSLGDTSFLGTGNSWKTTSKKSPQQTLQQDDDFDFYD